MEDKRNANQSHIESILNEISELEKKTADYESLNAALTEEDYD